MKYVCIRAIVSDLVSIPIGTTADWSGPPPSPTHWQPVVEDNTKDDSFPRRFTITRPSGCFLNGEEYWYAFPRDPLPNQPGLVVQPPAPDQDAEIQRLRVALEAAQEELAVAAANINHYFEAGCLPTKEEHDQVHNAAQAAKKVTWSWSY